MYKCKEYLLRKNAGGRITSWRASGIKNLSTNLDLKGVANAQGLLPIVEDNGRMNVEFNGNYFVQNKVLHPSNNIVVNIYIVYELDAISNTRNTDYTILKISTQGMVYVLMKVVRFQKVVLTMEET